MTRATGSVRSVRREEILEAAEECFADAGFHRTSIHDIATALGMSQGNIYHYFQSKEEIVNCIAQRNLKRATQWFAQLEKSRDFMATIELMAKYYLQSPLTKRECAIWAEIRAESLRNPAISQINREIDNGLKTQFCTALQSAAAGGRLDPCLDIQAAVYLLLALGEGLSWRRAVDPQFSGETVLPMTLDLLRKLLPPPQL